MTPKATTSIRLSPDTQLALRLRDERYLLPPSVVARLFEVPLRLPLGPDPAPILR